ncbi:unnamed protein product [Microthlaspi erraticum]|uniref:RNase H type-1 domain-containing protein n=1 Tax=Microthlaspi erraticum TaxID=1685480 RepID=A0A6D2HR81_9BRAS|nr:unnamed protein product [Microthlaspi erraticum]
MREYFGTNGKCRDRVRFIKDIATEPTVVHAKTREQAGATVRVERQIAWQPPKSGWWKMHTDGAARGNPGLASAGGVLQDASGGWVCGFALNIGICSAPLADLWGVYYGLYMAWEIRVPRLIIELDSKIVMGFHTGISDSHPLSFLVQLCYGFVSRDWLVRFQHAYREANRVSDGLANHAFSLPLGFYSFTSAPTEFQF